MTTTRVALITAAIVAGVLVAQGVIVGIWNIVFGYGVLGGSIVQIVEVFNVNLFWTLLTGLLHYAAFGAGVFLAIRFIAPLSAEVSWRRTITRGIVATVSGAIAAVIFDCVVSVIAAITIGPYPFGYALDAAVDPTRIQYGIQNTVAAAITPLIEWLPLVVLACVFLKLWLAAHPATKKATETKARASVAG
jgi:hypothetical protein